MPIQVHQRVWVDWVTAPGATGSSMNVTVTQAAAPVQSPVLSVSPTDRKVTKDDVTTTFDVSNAGTGTMPWMPL